MTAETPIETGINNPYQAPKSKVYPDFNHSTISMQKHPDLGERGSRLLAVIIDSIIYILAIIPIWLSFDIVTKTMDIGDLAINIPYSTYIAPHIYNFVMYLLINGYLLNKYGQTIGKRLIGIYIADVRTGEKASMQTIIFKRVLPISLIIAIPVFGLVISIIDVLLIFRKDKRCGHDFIAGTQIRKSTSLFIEYKL